jgi:hypothetical protein
MRRGMGGENHTAIMHSLLKHSFSEDLLKDMHNIKDMPRAEETIWSIVLSDMDFILLKKALISEYFLYTFTTQKIRSYLILCQLNYFL